MTEQKETLDKKLTSRNKLILGLTTAGLAVCVLIALFFSNPKKATPNKDSIQTAADVIAVAEQEVKSNPSSENILKLTALYIGNNMPGKVFPYLKNLIKKEPANAAAHNNLGVANIMLKNYMQGIASCSEAIKLDTGFQLAKNNLKWAIDEKNKVLAQIGQLAKVAEDKRDEAYFIQLGFCSFQIGDYDQSILAWNEGLKKFPSGAVTFYNNIGSALVLKKEYPAAIVHFNKALAIDANNQLAKNNIDWAKNEIAEEKQL